MKNIVKITFILEDSLTHKNKKQSKLNIYIYKIVSEKTKYIEISRGENSPNGRILKDKLGVIDNSENNTNYIEYSIWLTEEEFNNNEEYYIQMLKTKVNETLTKFEEEILLLRKSLNEGFELKKYDVENLWR